MKFCKNCHWSSRTSIDRECMHPSATRVEPVEGVKWQRLCEKMRRDDLGATGCGPGAKLYKPRQRSKPSSSARRG